ncbi:MAG: Gfo/Idh/MocA family oxidoreductase [bacterium]|nr:Gfo/Idh/MocA family oxidoreductase [bacterium]
MAKKLKNIKPLVIGIGVAGRRHLEAQLNLGFKTGVFTNNPQTAKSLREKNNVIVFDNLEEGIDWSNLVHVCTPDDKHTEFVAKAAKLGKAVLCEKAFTTKYNDALYLRKLAHEHGATVIVGQNYRLTPTFLETKKRVSEGQLGKINYIETTYFHDNGDYKRRYPNANFLYMGGSHAVDLACWIAGEQIISVKASSSENILSYQITVKFSSGLIGNIKLDASSPRSISGTDLIVSGEKGKLASNNNVGEINNKTLTIPIEIRIVDDYLSGKLTSFSPLPGVDEAVNTIKILDTIARSVSSDRDKNV